MGRVWKKTDHTSIIARLSKNSVAHDNCKRMMYPVRKH